MGSGRQGAGPSVVQESEGHGTHLLDYLPVPAGVTKGRPVLIPEVPAVIWQADLKGTLVSFLDLYPPVSAAVEKGRGLRLNHFASLLAPAPVLEQTFTALA